MALSFEAQATIERMRIRIASGEFVPELEMREVIEIIRGDRLHATTAGVEKRAKKAKPARKSSEELLNELENL